MNFNIQSWFKDNLTFWIDQAAKFSSQIESPGENIEEGYGK